MPLIEVQHEEAIGQGGNGLEVPGGGGAGGGVEAICLPDDWSPSYFCY